MHPTFLSAPTIAGEPAGCPVPGGEPAVSTGTPVTHDLLLLGGTGFLGGHLATAFVAAGHRVICPVRPGRDDEVRRLAASGAEVTRQAPAASLARVRPQVVVDAAWDGVHASRRGRRSQQRGNLDRLAAVLEAHDPDAPLTWVGLGSQAEYGPVEGKVAEDHPTHPASAYGHAKLAAHHLLETRLVGGRARLVWLRLFGVYGPGQPEGWLVRDAIDTLRAGEPLELTDGRQRVDYLYAADVAEACARVVATEAARGVLNVGSGRAVAVRTVVEQLHAITGSASPLRFGALPTRPGTPHLVEADITRVRALTGWAPTTSLADGLLATVQSLATSGPVDAR